jgi:hypothetical protein
MSGVYSSTGDYVVAIDITDGSSWSPAATGRLEHTLRMGQMKRMDPSSARSRWALNHSAASAAHSATSSTSM